MKLIRTVDAAGQVLCHDITQIIPGEFKGPRFRKGHVVTEEDIPVLLSMGKEHLYVWEMTPGMLQRLAPILEQSDEVIRFEGLNGVVRMSADAPDAPGYARTVGDAITQLQHYSAYKILMSTSLANRIAQDQAFEPLLCFNELELEVTEISPRECPKREGIQSVLDALDPHHGTVYGIGDASNDVSLMNAVDVGIAMGNAPDFLKEKADYVTDSIDHDGVVTALEHFGLI